MAGTAFKCDGQLQPEPVKRGPEGHPGRQTLFNSLIDETNAEHTHKEYAQLINWASLCDNCTFEEFQSFYLEPETPEQKRTTAKGKV